MATGGASDTCYNQGTGCQDDREIRSIYNLEVNNRYGVLGNMEAQDRESKDERDRKRKRVNTGSIGSEEFGTMTSDEKLGVIFTKLINIEQKQSQIDKMDSQIRSNHSEVKSVKAQTSLHEKALTYLSYKSLDLEARSRRKNLIFRGLSESKDEDCYDIIYQFLYDQLQLEDANIVMDRAHRVGRRNRRNFLKRPIIVAFRDYFDVDRILSRVYLLKGTRHGVDRDYPKEINNARRLMWNRYKEIKARKRKNDTVSLQYPARIVCNGEVIEDAFPGWYESLNGTRVEPFISESVKSANLRARGEHSSETDRHQDSTYRRDTVYSHRANNGLHAGSAHLNKENTDNRNQSSTTQQGTFGQTNMTNNSDSNSSIDGDDAMFYSQYVQSRIEQPEADNRNSYSPDQSQSDHAINMSIREFPPLSRQTSRSRVVADERGAKSSSSSMNYNPSNGNRQSNVFSGADRRACQSRDGSGDGPDIQ